jgi:Uma2 family endonuclease
MPPIGPPHACIVDRLAELLLLRLVGRATVRIQQPIVVAEDSEPEPDVAIMPKADCSHHHPDRALLVVEVAESSLGCDRETKGPLYAVAGVPECWVVDVTGRSIEVDVAPPGSGKA